MKNRAHPEHGATYRHLITSRRWAALRRAVLTAHPLCQRCQEQGRVRAATEVHHEEPVERGLTAAEQESLMFAPANLQALCHACHVEAHVELGRSGRRQAEAVRHSQLERFKARFMAETESGAGEAGE